MKSQSPGQSVLNDKKYTVDVFTEEAVLHGFPENSWDIDSPEELLNVIRNVSDPRSGIRRINIWINPGKEPIFPSVEERQVKEEQEERIQKEQIRALLGFSQPFEKDFEISRVESPAFTTPPKR